MGGMTEGSPGVDFWATMFDTVADTYDQSGVAFFRTIAGGLVERLQPQHGERVLELGSGRGAATIPLAEAVGVTGSVVGIDVSSRMVELLGEALAARGLTHVQLRQGDASTPPPGPYDVACASLVLFFLPDPVAALATWRAELAPGGRVGISTFARWTESMAAVDAIVASYRSADAPDSTRMPEAFRSDEGVEELFRSAGYAAVRTERATYDVVFDDIDRWQAWALGTAMRGPWMQVPDDRKPEALARIEAELAARDRRLQVDIRYTLAEA